MEKFTYQAEDEDAKLSGKLKSEKKWVSNQWGWPVPACPWTATSFGRVQLGSARLVTNTLRCHDFNWSYFCLLCDAWERRWALWAKWCTEVTAQCKDLVSQLASKRPARLSASCLWFNPTENMLLDWFITKFSSLLSPSPRSGCCLCSFCRWCSQCARSCGTIATPKCLTATLGSWMILPIMPAGSPSLSHPPLWPQGR